MGNALIGLGAFFIKELNEVRRQPRLILSLVLGPFLILFLFGVGYQSNHPQVRTALVIPPGVLAPNELQTLTETVGLNFNLIQITNDPEAALAKLRAGQLDLVQIIPGDVQARAAQGQQSPVVFTYNEVNPLNEQWITYLGYSQVSEINRALLIRNAVAMQGEAAATQAQLAETRLLLEQLQGGAQGLDQGRSRESLRRLRDVAGLLALNPLLANQALGGASPDQTRADLLQLRDDADTLDRALADGTVDRQQERVAAMRERVTQLEALIGRVSATPPNVLFSPLVQQYVNLRGRSLDLMTYYAPGVVALLVQHIAVTLGALSLVRERILGATEIFKVAPVSAGQVIGGKYLGYTLFIAIITAALCGLMYLMAVPFLGDLWATAGLFLLLTLASLGVGFLISAASTSDSQAIQLSMLVLLLSIFFSGFFLPLDNFWAPVQAVGYLLPLTHGISGLQDLMLRSVLPPPFTWAALGLMAGLFFILAWALSRRQLSRAVG